MVSCDTTSASCMQDVTIKILEKSFSAARFVSSPLLPGGKLLCDTGVRLLDVAPPTERSDNKNSREKFIDGARLLVKGDFC